MRTIVLAVLLFLASTQVATAQNVRTFGSTNGPLPEGLVPTLQMLQEEQLASLKLFTTYLEGRVKEKAVPEGVLLNAKAVYTEAELRATSDRSVKQEKMDELVEIYDKRKKLDARTPNKTWFGVNRQEIGTMMKAEYEAFRKQAEQPPKTPPRAAR
ncbi:hypothetical protein [Bremerella sp.]|uniref:hypothetical protein n=1 Tax=Bremerella sp. TaxID=2795602 RepID=UPI00391C025D